MKKKSFIKDVMKNPVSYLMLLPAAVYSLAFGYCTIPYMAIAFQKYSYKGGLLGSEWVGFRNFEFFFKSNDVLRIILNTIKLNLLFITFTTLSAVTLAILVNEVNRRRFKKIAQSCYLLPYFLSWAIVSYILNAIIGSKYGIANGFLEFLGLDRINFYVQPKYWTAILVILKVWKDLGMQMVIYLAAITGFDEEVYEAASIDGATRMQKIIHISIPCIMSTIIVLFIMRIGNLMSVGFEKVYLMQNSVTLSASEVISTFIYKNGIQKGQFSYSTAVGMFNSVINFILLIGANFVSKKTTKTGLW